MQLKQGVKAWQPEPVLWPDNRVNGLAFAPGSTLLTSVSSEGSVALWDGRGRMLQPLEGQGSGFNALTWRSAGRHLAPAMPKGAAGCGRWRFRRANDRASAPGQDSNLMLRVRSAIAARLRLHAPAGLQALLKRSELLIGSPLLAACRAPRQAPPDAAACRAFKVVTTFLPITLFTLPWLATASR